MSSLPRPRGPVSQALFDGLRTPPHALPAVTGPIEDEDLQLALYCCYELHYRGFEGVDDRWEWEPSLRELMQADQAPSVSTFIEREASSEQVLEFMIHRSAYQLKEADPHSWALPRLWGKPKAAMVEVQADEYGNGRPDAIHAELFARAMEAVGLDSTYGAYLDQIPAVTLATVNLMSLFGLHRRLRGAIVGHLALFEMTSSVPNRRYATGLRRLGHGEDACLFFDVHVVADAVHESVAAVDLAGGLAKQDPKLGADVLWGARALLEIDGRWAQHVMSAWDDDASSLHPALVLR
jgi:Iron-containing redox enzyme